SSLSARGLKTVSEPFAKKQRPRSQLPFTKQRNWPISKFACGSAGFLARVSRTRLRDWNFDFASAISLERAVARATRAASVERRASWIAEAQALSAKIG